MNRLYHRVAVKRCIFLKLSEEKDNDDLFVKSVLHLILCFMRARAYITPALLSEICAVRPSPCFLFHYHNVTATCQILHDGVL